MLTGAIFTPTHTDGANFAPACFAFGDRNPCQGGPLRMVPAAFSMRSPRRRHLPRMPTLSNEADMPSVVRGGVVTSGDLLVLVPWVIFGVALAVICYLLLTRRYGPGRARRARRRRPPQPPPEGQLGETHQAPPPDQDASAAAQAASTEAKLAWFLPGRPPGCGKLAPDEPGPQIGDGHRFVALY